MTKSLSPCVSSAVSALPSEVTAWELAKHLYEMHPEYTDGKVKEEIARIDGEYQGEKRPIQEWLELLSKKYPEAGSLHTQLVMVGLYDLDPEQQRLIPSEIVEAVRAKLY